MSNTYELHEKIEELLSAKEFKRLKELFLHENPVDIAEALDGFSRKRGVDQLPAAVQGAGGGGFCRNGE